KGRRPTWSAAAPGGMSEPLYEALCRELEDLGTPVQRGVFGAQMEVSLVNDGPFTLTLESPCAHSGQISGAKLGIMGGPMPFDRHDRCCPRRPT
ncbi:MAG: D-aminoacyl-tRNA deacylase, partial [Marmoricola sp.]